MSLESADAIGSPETRDTRNATAGEIGGRALARLPPVGPTMAMRTGPIAPAAWRGLGAWRLGWPLRRAG